jgi:hypothetical protein
MRLILNHVVQYQSWIGRCQGSMLIGRARIGTLR